MTGKTMAAPSGHRICLALALLLCGAVAHVPARAEPLAEVPDGAIENYLTEDMTKIPDGVYIPYPEEVEEFKNSPLYKFLESLGPEEKRGSKPSGRGCPVNKKFLENV